MGLSNAEKQARFRERRQTETARLRAENATLKAENATLKAELAKPAKAAAAPSAARDEIERQKAEIAALKAEIARDPRKIPRTVEELLAAKQRAVEERKANRAAAKAFRAATAAASETPGDDDDIETLRERITKLERELKGNKTQLHNMREFYRPKGVLTFAAYSKIMKCLHPDYRPSDAERIEACGLLSEWKQGAEKARRRAR